MGKIIDVSPNNGVIDWNKEVSDGVTDVIIRLSPWLQYKGHINLDLYR